MVEFVVTGYSTKTGKRIVMTEPSNYTKSLKMATKLNRVSRTYIKAKVVPIDHTTNALSKG